MASEAIEDEYFDCLRWVFMSLFHVCACFHCITSK